MEDRCKHNVPNNIPCLECDEEPREYTPARPNAEAVPCSDWVAELEADLREYIGRKAAATNGTEMHGYWWGCRDTAETILARAKERRRSATVRVEQRREEPL